ncbi:hypothetical protein BGX34_001802 [Mortierella sp. NVP85]|nr:hypothetical protein BGX34_001802 [Mortierella sp. NVP85]
MANTPPRVINPSRVITPPKATILPRAILLLRAFISLKAIILLKTVIPLRAILLLKVIIISPVAATLLRSIPLKPIPPKSAFMIISRRHEQQSWRSRGYAQDRSNTPESLSGLDCPWLPSSIDSSSDELDKHVPDSKSLQSGTQNPKDPNANGQEDVIDLSSVPSISSNDEPFAGYPHLPTAEQPNGDVEYSFSIEEGFSLLENRGVGTERMQEHFGPLLDQYPDPSIPTEEITGLEAGLKHVRKGNKRSGIRLGADLFKTLKGFKETLENFLVDLRDDNPGRVEESDLIAKQVIPALQGVVRYAKGAPSVHS